MSSGQAKRYRRYLEPERSRTVPRQTRHNQRVRQCGAALVNGGPGVPASVSGSDNLPSASPLSSHSPVANANQLDDEELDEEFPDCDDPDVARHDLLMDDSEVESDSDGQGSSTTEEQQQGPPDDDGYDENHGFEGNSDVSEDSDRSDQDCASDASDHGEEDDDVESFFKKCEHEKLPNQEINKAQAMLLVMAYVVYAGLTWSQVDGLLKLINTLCGTTVLPESKYLYRKMWEKRMGSLGVHFYCQRCDCYLGSGDIKDRSRKLTCSQCKVTHPVNQLFSQGSFFLIFNLKQHLLSVIAETSAYLYDGLKSALSPVYGIYSDITGGRLYRSIREHVGAQWSDITLTINTDGSPVFKCSKYSVWPIQLMLNELPFDIRSCNVVVGALWFAKCHPPAHLFMKTFVSAVNSLKTISWEHAGERITSKIFVTCCSVDSPARASLLNMKQFNGFYGCPWCLEKGTVVDRTLRYIPRERAAALRTHRSVDHDMREAFEQGRPVHGIKGPSALLKLNGFNLVWCLPPDYMHCVLEGVTQQLTELWLTAAGMAFYVGRQLQEVESRIRDLRPPVSFCRLPRPISERKSSATGTASGRRSRPPRARGPNPENACRHTAARLGPVSCPVPCPILSWRNRQERSRYAEVTGGRAAGSPMDLTPSEGDSLGPILAHGSRNGPSSRATPRT
ncbi:hypothetical protein MTO96_025974 [Rhipicephalus appendiculatus]